MSPALTVFVLLDTVVLALAALLVAVRRRPPGLGLLGGMVLLELTLLVQGVVAGIGLLGGRRAAEPAVHAGYLIASVALLPLLVVVAGRPDPESRRSPWSALVAAVACAALFVVQVRLVATGPGGGGAPPH